MTRPYKIETKKQLASQDYDCDGCHLLIPEETYYLRVAVLSSNRKQRRRNHSSADTIEKWHERCWNDE